MEKLFAAFGDLKITSFRDLLGKFGLADLPVGHMYGIAGGIFVFAVTIISVLVLLVKGGSLTRIAEQAQGEGELAARMLTDRTALRKQRGLLLERLIGCRDYLVQAKAEAVLSEEKSEYPHVTEKLLNFDPKLPYGEAGAGTPPEVVDEDSNAVVVPKPGRMVSDMQKILSTQKKGDAAEVTPEMRVYETHFIEAYRACQDLPGGKILPGLPEARFEAYARSFAAAPDNGGTTAKWYRRSYGRMYEALSCRTHGEEGRFRKLYQTRPRDIVGRTVRLEPLEPARHAEELALATCGDAHGKDTEYDPMDVWGFLPYGPFHTAYDMAAGPIFDRKSGEGGFAIVEHVTEKVIGAILLYSDDPQNLTIGIEVPVTKPTCDGTVEHMEACFLVMDRLFAYGYRRVHMSCDSQDAIARKVPGRLGMTQEGLVLKDQVVRDANRDSLLFAMLNSDWDKGARTFLFGKLHGDAAARADRLNLENGEGDDQKIASLKEQAECAKAKKKEAKADAQTKKQK